MHSHFHHQDLLACMLGNTVEQSLARGLGNQNGQYRQLGENIPCSSQHKMQGTREDDHLTHSGGRGRLPGGDGA